METATGTDSPKKISIVRIINWDMASCLSAVGREGDQPCASLRTRAGSSAPRSQRVRTAMATNEQPTRIDRYILEIEIYRLGTFWTRTRKDMCPPITATHPGQTGKKP